MSAPAGAVPPHKRPSLVSCLVLLNLVLVVGLAQAAVTPTTNSICVNYGRLGDNLLPPAQVVQLMKTNKIGTAKIFDHDPTVIAAFANSGIHLMIGVTNQEVTGIGQSTGLATQWVQQNVVPYYPATQISTVVVGNELLTYTAPENIAISSYLNQALLNLYAALKTVGLHRNIKLSTAVAYDAFNSSYPPSAGSFRPDLTSLLTRLLGFLNSTGSPFMINVYPFFAYASNPNVSLDYATFGVSAVPVVDGTVVYKNILTAQLDALYCAMDKLGYSNVSIAISETGWPTMGDPDQRGASIANAAAYNRRLVRDVIAGTGTPARPDVFVPTCIFALFNEDLKPGPATERNWGLFYPSGSPVYPIDLTGQLADSGYQPLGDDTAPPPPPQSSTPPPPFSSPQNSPPAPSVPAVPPPPPPPVLESPPPPVALAPPSTVVSTPPPPPVTPPPTVVTYPPPPAVALGTPQWCTCNPSATDAALQLALDYACGQGQADCGPIQIGQPCFNPNTVLGHASYAMNRYWQQTKPLGGTCDFAGAGMLTTVDPSVGGCIYPSN